MTALKTTLPPQWPMFNHRISRTVDTFTSEEGDGMRVRDGGYHIHGSKKSSSKKTIASTTAPDTHNQVP